MFFEKSDTEMTNAHLKKGPLWFNEVPNKKHKILVYNTDLISALLLQWVQQQDYLNSSSIHPSGSRRKGHGPWRNLKASRTSSKVESVLLF